MFYPPVAIIVLNWNGRRLLNSCLSALTALDYPDYKIIVADNASSDDSIPFVQTAFPEVEILLNGANLGFSAGNNAALRRLTTPFAVLLNPDVFVSPDWLKNIIRPLLDDETAGIVGGKLHYPNGRVIQHVGGFVTPPRAMPGHFGIGEQDEGQYDQERDVDYLLGGAMALRRQMLDEIGLLDEDFFLYFEDAEFCFRAKKAGWRVVYTPTATAVHAESALTGKGSPAYLRRFHTGRWLFILKQYPPSLILKETIPAEKAWLSAVYPVERAAAAAAYRAIIGYNGRMIHETQEDKAQQLEINAGLEELRETAVKLDDPVEEWQVVERPFVSNIPLVAKFRELWNSVSAKWYVRPLTAQQNEINRQLVETVRQLENRLVAQDRDQMGLVHDTAELTAQLTQINRRLASIDQRLQQLEQTKKVL